MTQLRFRTRHVHQTVCDYVKAQMVALGWGDTGLPLADPINSAVPFGAKPLSYMEVQPDEEGVPITPNLLAITLGDAGEDDLQQLGGGYYELPMPVFFDVYGESQGIAQSIASDVKDVVNYQLSIPVVDYTSSQLGAPTSELILFEDVTGPERPPASQVAADVRRHWRLVRGTVRVYHGG